MENYSFQKDLIKSLNIAINTNGKYTYIYNPILKKEFKLLLNKNSISWVMKYKEQRIEDFLEKKRILNIQINDDLFCYIYYFYLFILQDIWRIFSFIPKKIENVLDIGAGIGLFEIYLNFVNPQINKFTIIEKENLFHNNTIIDVLKICRDTALSYKLKDKFIFFNDTNYLNINQKFDLVLSFRSWCYKYDIDTYLSFVLKSIDNNSSLIIDIRNNYNADKIINKFQESKIITSYTDHKRFLLRKLIK